MARSGFVDGVPYSINFKSNLVTVGIGLVGKAERDQGWKVKGNARTATDAQIEEQVRARDKFAELKARAAMAAGGVPYQQPDGDGAPHWPPSLVAIACSRRRVLTRAGGAGPSAKAGLFDSLDETMENIADAISSSPRSSSVRERKQPKRFGVDDMELTAAQVNRFNSRSTGTRIERLPERECMRPGCVNTRAERDELRRKLEAEQNRFQQEMAAARAGFH